MSTTREYRAGGLELADNRIEPINGWTERPTTPPDDLKPPPADHCSECGRELDSYEGECAGCGGEKLYCSDCMLYADEGCCSVDCLRKVTQKAQAEAEAMKKYFRDVHVALASGDLTLARTMFGRHCGPFAKGARRAVPESVELALDALGVAIRAWREIDEQLRRAGRPGRLPEEQLRRALRMLQDRAVWVAERMHAGGAL